MLRRFFSFILTVVVIILLAFGLRTFVFQAYTVPSGSMEDTIETGDMVFAEKVSYHFHEPAQGDIVTFDDPLEPDRILIKRVIAVGGQTISFADGIVYIDGVPLDEPYVEGKPTERFDRTEPVNGIPITYPYTVPEDEIWVMGDNRTNSQDSRYFGAVDVSTVSSRAVLTYWPIRDFGLLS